MSVMEKRLQLLLDAHRWELVSRAAQEGHRSAASVIREAIDTYFASDDADARRAQAAQAWLVDVRSDPAPVDDDVVRALHADFDDDVMGSAVRW